MVGTFSNCIALGGGFEVGAEVTDFIIILTSRSAVEAFSKGGNVTLGGNLTVAAGPIGRNCEGDVSMRSPAAVYTYSKTRGLFAGVSIEGSYLIERKDANKKFYCREVRSSEILSGEIDAGTQCQELYSILLDHDSMFERVLDAKSKEAAAHHGSNKFWRSSSKRSSVSGSSMRREWTSSSNVGNDYSSKKSSSYKGSWADSDSDDEPVRTRARAGSINFSNSPSKRPPPPKSVTTGNLSQSAKTKPVRRTRESAGAIPKAGSQFASQTTGSTAWDKPTLCKALWRFEAKLPCDLSFKPGDIIEIRTRTHTQDDWWEGSCKDGKVGIFPANYVELFQDN